MRRRAVFVDRDGVVNAALVRNGKPFSPMSLKDLRVLAGVREACELIRAAGLLIVVVTNQPEIARGRLSPFELDQIHNAIRRELAIDAIYTCPHDDKDGCSCRKPKPGLIFKASEELGIDPAASYLVGDRWRDIEAGQRAGCTTVLLEAGYDEPQLEPDKRVCSLLDAARWIVDKREGQSCPERSLYGSRSSLTEQTSKA